MWRFSLLPLAWGISMVAHAIPAPVTAGASTLIMPGTGAAPDAGTETASAQTASGTQASAPLQSSLWDQTKSMFAVGQSPEAAHWIANFQSTYITAQHPAFRSPYSGPHSLNPNADHAYTFTGTAFLGWRPFTGTEFYIDPEISQGVPFSNLTGLAAEPNGEAQKAAGAHPKLYRARLFLRQTFDLGGEAQHIAADKNQFATTVKSRRLVFTVGNFATNDIFDGNAYSHDPRTQFMNWTIMDYGAWDFAADARGFSRGGVAELYWDNWAFRAGRMLMPEESNGEKLNVHIADYHGDNYEIEHAHTLFGQPGKIRVLAYRNVANMGTYSAAVAWGLANGVTPDLAAVRSRQSKLGHGISLEQAITDNVGMFARFSADDGEGEEYAWTEANRSTSGGFLVKNVWMNRPDDTYGIGYVRDELSSAHRQYLALGGLGFFLGDGKLNYRPEEVLEVFYNMKVAKRLWVSPDYQHIANPGYNADRGPVDYFGVRMHTEI